MKKVIISLLVLLFVCTLGAAFYILNSDLIGQNKDKIAEQFYNATGKAVRFDGDVSFKLLPVPHLQANNVKIFNSPNNTDYTLADIRSLDAQVALKPLLGGELEVTKMVLSDVKFNIDWDKGFSWQSDLSPDQRIQMENTNLTLNSVQIKGAELVFSSEENHINFTLTNINGEMSAESIMGPFRMEGNYLNGSTPEGFAMTIGRLSETSATTLNLAVTHPNSNSYIRFDGSFQTTNKVINGNIIIESDNLSKFANTNFERFKIPEEYNKKTALGFDIALNSQNLALSNMVIKYGENTQGSGNLQIPLNSENKKINVVFNFVDLDLNELKNFAVDLLDKYKKNEDLPEIELEGSVKAARAYYGTQQIKNISTEFTYADKVFSLKSLDAILPGNTSVLLNGDLFPFENILHYKGDINLRTDNLIQTLKWLNIEPIQAAPAVYKNMVLNAKISGNLDRTQISPFKITLDKTTIEGEAGIVWGTKKDVMLIVKADAINFDNYIAPLPEETKGKSWLERVGYRFSQLGILNDIDLVLDTKADLVIYESMPFEKVAFKGNILNKKAEIEYLNIDKIANTKINLDGNISGFGAKPQVENLHYTLRSSDISSLINKLELKVPDLDYKRFSNLETKGTINGSPDEFGINTTINLGNLNADFAGKITNSDNYINIDGDLTFKHPNFNQLLSNLQSSYIPSGDNLGLIQFKAKVKGNKDNLKIDDLETDIGQTNIKGYASYEKLNNRPSILTDLHFNKLDATKFLPQSKTASAPKLISLGERESFLSRPTISKEDIDYTFYRQADIKANIAGEELLWYDWLLKETNFELDIINNTISFKNMQGIYNDTPFKTDIMLKIDNEPTIAWNGSIQDAAVNNFNLAGKVYGLKDGIFSTDWNFISSARNSEEFWKNLKGTANFIASGVNVIGFDSKDIYEDLLKRNNNDGLSEKVRDALKKGSTPFTEVKGKLNIENGKFSLADTQMTADNLNIKTYGEGNLSDWSMNAVFNAKFAEPQYLPEFSFLLKDSISEPVVDVNVSSLFKFYQAKVDQREAEAEKVVETARQKREDVWTEQKIVMDNLVTSARNDLDKEIDDKIAKAYSEKSKDKYTALKQELANVLGGLVESINSYELDKLQDNDLIKMDEINKKAKSEAKLLKYKVSTIYLEDLQIGASNLEDKLTGEYNSIKQASFNYAAMLKKYNDKLSNIKTNYTFEDDIEYQRKKSEIEAKINELEGLNTKAATLKSKGTFNSAEDYEKYIAEIENILAQSQNGHSQLLTMIDDFDESESAKIDAAAEIYHNEVEKAENEKLLKENTGSISIKKSGKVVTVKRELDEIKNAQEDVSSEKVRVLDFTKPKADVTTEEEPGVGIVKKGRNRIAN